MSHGSRTNHSAQGHTQKSSCFAPKRNRLSSWLGVVKYPKFMWHVWMFGKYLEWFTQTRHPPDCLKLKSTCSQVSLKEVSTPLTSLQKQFKWDQHLTLQAKTSSVSFKQARKITLRSNHNLEFHQLSWDLRLKSITVFLIESYENRNLCQPVQGRSFVIKLIARFFSTSLVLRSFLDFVEFPRVQCSA